MEQNQLANIRTRTQQRIDKERQASQSDQLATKLSSIDDTILQSFKLMIDYLNKRTSKTEVVNQLKSISTPDVEKVVRAVQKLTDVTVDQNIDTKPLIKLLENIQDELTKIPKELPKEKEQREDVKVSNLSEIKFPEFDTSTLEKAIKGLKLESPSVNVAAPNVQVDAPDMKPIRDELLNVVKAIKSQKYPTMPETDLSKVESELKTSNKKLQELVDKPGPNLGPGTPYVSSDGTGKPVMVTLTPAGKIPVDTAAATYITILRVKAADPETTYIGKAVPGSLTSQAVWQIASLDENTNVDLLYADGGAFTQVYDDRESLTYA